MGFSSTTLLLLCTASLALLLAIPATAIDHMLPGDTLRSGESLSAANNTYDFIMQFDCNLVLYHLDTAIWASRTDRKSNGCYLTFQRDGNLVIFDIRNETIWKSNTDGEDGEYILILQNNGNLALYNHPVWETETEDFIVAAWKAMAAVGSSAAKGAEVGGRKAKMARIGSVTGDE